MSDHSAADDTSGLPDETADVPVAPHRVIGTPPPATARTMLGQRAGDGAAGDGPLPAVRELPEDPPDQRHAKKAERLVGALFILSLLASIGFIAAYVGLEVGTVDSTLRSNLALGLAMSVAFLAVAVGVEIAGRVEYQRTIWIGGIAVGVELVQDRLGPNALGLR